LPGSLEAELPRQRSCGALARRLIEQQYGKTLDRSTLADLNLVASELVNNAFVHGEGRIRLRLEQTDERLRIEVMDEGENAAIKIRRLGVREGGHGLRLVDHLCAAWGAFEGSTHVWADLIVAG
jgi:anti-sigma regulatory factor (Ser/Thr protein kinase)